MVLLFLLVGGGLAWSAWNSMMSGFFAQLAPKNEVCSTLDDDARLDLVGVETPKRLFPVEGALDRYTCRWATEDYKTVTTFVEVVSAPADEWAAGIRSKMASMDVGQVTKQSNRLLRMARKSVETPAEGCRLARVLFAASGAPPGATRVVRPTMSTNGTPMMLAHSCVDGTYSAVMVVAPDLELDRSLGRKTAQALRSVEKRLD